MKFISAQYWYFSVVSHWRSQYDRNKFLVKTFAADASEHQNKHPSNKFEKKAWSLYLPHKILFDRKKRRAKQVQKWKSSLAYYDRKNCRKVWHLQYAVYKLWDSR